MRYVKAFIKKHVLRADSGGVLFEYVLMMVLIVLPLVGVSKFISSPSGTELFSTHMPTDSEPGNYGALGNEFVNWVRRIISGVSLPVP